jgi:hypothetical protein
MCREKQKKRGASSKAAAASTGQAATGDVKVGCVS